MTFSVNAAARRKVKLADQPVIGSPDELSFRTRKVAYGLPQPHWVPVHVAPDTLPLPLTFSNSSVLPSFATKVIVELAGDRETTS